MGMGGFSGGEEGQGEGVKTGPKMALGKSSLEGGRPAKEKGEWPSGRRAKAELAPGGSENFARGWWHAARRSHEEEVERRRRSKGGGWPTLSVLTFPASLCARVVVLSAPPHTVTTRATPASEGHAIPSLLT